MCSRLNGNRCQKRGQLAWTRVMVENLQFPLLIGSLLCFQTPRNRNSTLFLGELHQYVINPFLKTSLSHTITFDCGKCLTFIGLRMVSLRFPRWSRGSASFLLYRQRKDEKRAWAMVFRPGSPSTVTKQHILLFLRVWSPSPGLSWWHGYEENHPGATSFPYRAAGLAGGSVPGNVSSESR